MNILVLAGGFGSRLSAAINGQPKALAPIQGKPFLYYQIEHWISQGMRSFVFLLHYRADLVKQYLESESNNLFLDCDFRVIIEPEPLDTGGAIAHALQEINLTESFIATNADTWIGGGVKEVMLSGPDALAIIEQEKGHRFGQVELSTSGAVRAFSEKGHISKSPFINAGLYHLNAKHFTNWNGARYSLERDLLPKLVTSQGLKAVMLETDFIDIGVPEDYFRFCKWQESGRQVRL